MRRTLAIALFLLLASLAGAAPARNVIVMVPDGCENSIATLARWYTGRPLALDPVLAGATGTHSAASVITGSAAAVTAFSTGHKTTIGFLGVGPETTATLEGDVPDSLVLRPLPTVLEAAMLEGKATGLVATSTMSHATPAGYAAHVTDRDHHYDIMKQLAHADLDVVFGGGRRYLLSKADGGRRSGPPDLRGELEKRGAKLVFTAGELEGLNSTPTWGLFADKHMSPELDRARFAPDEPSLAEMTEKAIELLDSDPDGFVLLVEGSQVDWAAHANDPVHMVTDFVAFDDAARVALEFAREDGSTLVLAFPDHDCGGFSIGHERAAVGYKQTSLDFLLDPLRKMKLTADGIVRLLGEERSPDSVRALVEREWSVTLTDAEIEEILKLEQSGYDFDYALSEVFCRERTAFGWTTHGHTGDEVPLWAYGPHAPSGFLDNTDIARVCAEALDLDLAGAGQELFVDVETEFGPGSFSIDSTEKYCHVLEIGNARLVLDTDLLITGADTSAMPGISLWIRESGRAWVPRAAVPEIRRAR